MSGHSHEEPWLSLLQFWHAGHRKKNKIQRSLNLLKFGQPVLLLEQSKEEMQSASINERLFLRKHGRRMQGSMS